MIRRAVAALRDLATFNSLYARSSDFRAEHMRSMSAWLLAARPSAESAAEQLRATPAAAVHAGLSPAALALTGLSVDAGAAPHLNLVLSELVPGRVFAGVHTALEAAWSLAGKLGYPLRVVTLSPSSAHPEAAADAERMLAERYGSRVAVVPRAGIGATSFSAADAWLVTHWTTAHAAQVAATDGSIPPGRVVYLVQDFEPGFSAWSTDSMIARGTYRAGFIPLVNSVPLAGYLADKAGVDIDPEMVFAPALDDSLLRSVAEARGHGPVRVMFYGRPGKPRNLYALGIAALRQAVLLLGEDADRVTFVSAGETHPSVDLGGGTRLTSLGALPWDRYFDELASSAVVLSLQASPHPSHPPLEAAVSGAWSVTNDFDGTRAGLHPRLAAVDADPLALGSAVAEAIRVATAGPSAGYQPIASEKLGNPLSSALNAVAARLA